MPQNNMEMDCSLLNMKNDPAKFLVGSATKGVFGRLDSNWTTQPAAGDNFMIPRKRAFGKRVMLLSLDPLEDIYLKQ